jgi:RNA polymerase sigma factor (sigma-70 family)
MEVRSHTGEGELAERGSRGPEGRGHSHAPAALLPERVGALLGKWQARELRIARGFHECRGLSTEQLEDLYQETALALLNRPYRDEGHLRNALRTGLKHRALNLHRDERRRGEILVHSAPSLYRIARAREAEDGPEGAALARQDRLIVSEFLTELSAIEQRVFWLLAEGMRYRAIAPVLGIATNEARNAARACERKRERFQLLYDTGRLCGFRSASIQALQTGEATSEELARRAFAHLEGCAHCRAEHKTNARRLRRSFQGQASVLLPLPALARWGWLQRHSARARSLHHRLATDGVPMGHGGARETAAGALLGGGAVAKVAATVATVAVIAGSAITASTVVEHPRAHARADHRAARSVAARPSVGITPVQGVAASPAPPADAGAQRVLPTAAGPAEFGPGHVVPIAAATPRRPRGPRREPGGFAYLGAASRGATPAGSPGSAHTATAAGSGGAFSP